MKRILLIIGLIALIGVSCNTFADTCDGYTAVYNENCNSINWSVDGWGCRYYYTIIDGNKYSCGFGDLLNDDYCDVDLSHICDTDDNCTNPSKNLGMFNFGSEVVGDVVNTWVIDYTCEGNKYYTCFWNNTVPEVLPNISFYNRNSLTINSTYSNTDFFTNYYSPLPTTEYSPGFITNCNNTYICVSNSSEVNESTMIETTHYYSVIITPTNCSTTTSTTTTSSTSNSSSSSSSPTSSSSSSSSPSTTTYTLSTYPAYGYTLPNGNYGTLPGLNGTGGNTINNGTLKNMPCTGYCIIGLKKEEFELFVSLMVIIVVLVSVKPFKLGATASAIALLFFNSIVGWSIITSTLQLIFIFLALIAWKEDKE